MRTVSALIAGIRGAENGTADIYSRGTTSRASLYSDLEGTTMVAAQLTLDANGGCEVYVNEYVDVVVRDSAGDIVREFSEGDTANHVEYRGQSFTGTNYDDASTGQGSRWLRPGRPRPPQRPCWADSIVRLPSVIASMRS